MYPTGKPVFPILSHGNPCGNNVLYTPPGVPSHSCLRLLLYSRPFHETAEPEACTRYQKVISRSEMSRMLTYPNSLSACAEMCSATFNYYQADLSNNPLPAVLLATGSIILLFNRRNQPCLCLCLGFSQMILMEPFLLMTLHFSQIGFTDALTFILT